MKRTLLVTVALLVGTFAVQSEGEGYRTVILPVDCASCRVPTRGGPDKRLSGHHTTLYLDHTFGVERVCTETLRYVARAGRDGAAFRVVPNCIYGKDFMDKVTSGLNDTAYFTGVK